MKTKLSLLLFLIFAAMSFAQEPAILRNLDVRVGFNYEFGMYTHDPEAVLQWENSPLMGLDVDPEQKFSPTYMYKPYVYIKLYRIGIGYSEYGNKIFDSIGSASETDIKFKSGDEIKVEGITGNTEISLDWYIQESLALTASFLDMRYEADFDYRQGSSSMLNSQQVFESSSKGMGIGITTNNEINRRYGLRLQFMYYPSLETEYFLEEDSDNPQSFNSYVYAAKVNVDRKLISGLFATAGLDWMHSADNDKFVRNTRLMLDAGLYFAF